MSVQSIESLMGMSMRVYECGGCHSMYINAKELKKHESVCRKHKAIVAEKRMTRRSTMTPKKAATEPRRSIKRIGRPRKYPFKPVKDIPKTETLQPKKKRRTSDMLVVPSPSQLQRDKAGRFRRKSALQSAEMTREQLRSPSTSKDEPQSLSRTSIETSTGDWASTPELKNVLGKKRGRPCRVTKSDIATVDLTMNETRATADVGRVNVKPFKATPAPRKRFVATDSGTHGSSRHSHSDILVPETPIIKSTRKSNNRFVVEKTTTSRGCTMEDEITPAAISEVHMFLDGLAAESYSSFADSVVELNNSQGARSATNTRKHFIDNSEPNSIMNARLKDVETEKAMRLLKSGDYLCRYLASSDFSDAVITTDIADIPVHKLVLASRYPQLSQFLKTESVLNMSYLHYGDVSVWLKYIYTNDDSALSSLPPHVRRRISRFISQSVSGSLTRVSHPDGNIYCSPNGNTSLTAQPHSTHHTPAYPPSQHTSQSCGRSSGNYMSTGVTSQHASPSRGRRGSNHMLTGVTSQHTLPSRGRSSSNHMLTDVISQHASQPRGRSSNNHISTDVISQHASQPRGRSSSNHMSTDVTSQHTSPSRGRRSCNHMSTDVMSQHTSPTRGRGSSNHMSTDVISPHTSPSRGRRSCSHMSTGVTFLKKKPSQLLPTTLKHFVDDSINNVVTSTPLDPNINNRKRRKFPEHLYPEKRRRGRPPKTSYSPKRSLKTADTSLGQKSATNTAIEKRDSILLRSPVRSTSGGAGKSISEGDKVTPANRSASVASKISLGKVKTETNISKSVTPVGKGKESVAQGEAAVAGGQGGSDSSKAAVDDSNKLVSYTEGDKASVKGRTARKRGSRGSKLDRSSMYNIHKFTDNSLTRRNQTALFGQRKAKRIGGRKAAGSSTPVSDAGAADKTEDLMSLESREIRVVLERSAIDIDLPVDEAEPVGNASIAARSADSVENRAAALLTPRSKSSSHPPRVAKNGRRGKSVLNTEFVDLTASSLAAVDTKAVGAGSAKEKVSGNLDQDAADCHTEMVMSEICSLSPLNASAVSGVEQESELTAYNVNASDAGTNLPPTTESIEVEAFMENSLDTEDADSSFSLSESIDKVDEALNLDDENSQKESESLTNKLPVITDIFSADEADSQPAADAADKASLDENQTVRKTLATPPVDESGVIDLSVDDGEAELEQASNVSSELERLVGSPEVETKSATSDVELISDSAKPASTGTVGAKADDTWDDFDGVWDFSAVAPPDSGPIQDTETAKTPNASKGERTHKAYVPSPHTPMENFNSLNNEQLKKRMRDFGLRDKMSRKRMVAALTQIYTETHQYETDTSAEWTTLPTPHKLRSINKEPTLRSACKLRRAYGKRKSSAKLSKAESGKDSEQKREEKRPLPRGKNAASQELAASNDSPALGAEDAADLTLSDDGGGVDRPASSQNAATRNPPSDTGNPPADTGNFPSDIDKLLDEVDELLDDSDTDTWKNNKTLTFNTSGSESESEHNPSVSDDPIGSNVDNADVIPSGDIDATLRELVVKDKDLYSRILSYQMVKREEMIRLVKAAGVKCSLKQLDSFCFKQCIPVQNKNAQGQRTKKKPVSKRSKKKGGDVNDKPVGEME